MPIILPTLSKMGYDPAMRHYFPIMGVLVIYLTIGSLFAILVPDWQAPDEPAHYNYVAQLANGRLPKIEPGDYDQEYLDTIRGEQFAPQYSIDSITYEDWQPPLYYLLLTPIFWLTNGSLLALRLTSLLMGAGVVILAYLAVVELTSKKSWIPLTTAVFVAFLPQHLSIMSSVNNDSLAELMIAAILYTLIRWQREDNQNRLRNRYFLVTAGCLLGLGLLTKLTVYFMVPTATMVILWRYWKNWDRLFRAAILLYAPAFLLGCTWWIRNLLVYDGIDPLAMAAHNTVVVGQPRTTDLIAAVGWGETIQSFLQTTFNSFWGQFGWMAVPMPPWVYQPLLIFSLVVFVGLLSRPFLATDKDKKSILTLPAVILILMVFFTVGTHIYYNLTFIQHQGRYLFPALIPIGIGVAIGLETWGLILNQLGEKNWRTAVSQLVPVGLGIGLAGLDLVALFKFILPTLN